MSVRVVNKEPSPSVVKEVICPECGVTLSYAPKDILVYMDYEGDVYFRGIICPNCKERIYIKK